MKLAALRGLKDGAGRAFIGVATLLLVRPAFRAGMWLHELISPSGIPAGEIWLNM